MLPKILQKKIKVPWILDRESFESRKLGHLNAQRLAFSCAEEISKIIRPGMTEKQTAQLMDTYLKDHGVELFFHHSFAWFGERSSFTGFSNWTHFLPTKKILKENMPFILDTAPIVKGYAADIGFSGYMGDTRPKYYNQAVELLLQFRIQIREMFSDKIPTTEIWQEIHQTIQASGFRNCHKDYPFAALGHKVHYFPFWKMPGLTKPFSIQALNKFFSKGFLPEILGPRRNNSHTGLWAIEPHFGNDQFGIKFEEILVVEDEKVYWLEDDVPHIKIAKEQGFYHVC